MIHRYELNGLYIVLDIESGSVHVVDALAYDVIGLVEESAAPDRIVDEMQAKYRDDPEITEGEIRETIEDVQALRREGRLFSAGAVNEDLTALKRAPVVKALCLHAAHACNLRCAYCFAGQGNYHGETALMSYEVGQKALDFLIANSGARRNLEVDFFGGEPLLNWDVVKRLVAYAREKEKSANKRFRFTLTTNGVLLDDEVIDFCNREMDNVVLSLDGRPSVNDRMRKTPGGAGSYRDIVPKFQRFVSQRGDKGYYMRGTFTHENVDFLEDILHMAELGFTQLSMEPVVCAPDAPYALTEEDLPRLMAQYEQLAVEMLRREERGEGFTFYHYMLDLAGGPCVYKRVAGCGSGTEYLAVTPEGDLYPCHQFVGDEKYRMGTVDTGVTNTALREEFGAVNVFTREKCRTCWARMYCSGGCAANAYHATGSILGTFDYGCELFKKRMECAIMIQAAKATAGE